MEDSDGFDLHRFLPYLLNQAADVVGLEFQRAYKGRYGMLRTEWRVLFHLGQYGDLTARQICDMARLHKTKVSRAVSALEQKRFLSRREMEDDRRQSRLTLTRLGWSVFRDLHGAARTFDARLREEMSEEEADVLRRCLIRIARLEERS